MELALIDTDILSEVLKAKNVAVLRRTTEYLAEFGRLSFSAITYYEIVRGMRASGAARQLKGFESLVATSDVLPIAASVLDQAADLWAAAHRSGQPRNDADLLIAASAITANRILVTGNKTHFEWIPGLRIEDWR